MGEKSNDLKSLRWSAGVGYHDEIATRWSAGYGQGSFKRRLSSLVPILARHVQPGQSWLDLGCGSGVLTKELLNLQASVVAVDGSPAMLQEARTHVGIFAVEPRWIQGDVQSLVGLSDAAFDGVLCSSVIEYVDRPRDLLLEVARVLRSGGLFILSVPPRLSAVRTVQKIVRRAAQRWGQNAFPYLAVSRFEVEPSYVHRWLDEAGFKVDRVTYFDPVLPTRLIPLIRSALMIIEAHRKQDA